MRLHRVLVAAAFALAGSAIQAAAADKDDPLNAYLVDITAGAVSAAGLIKSDKGPAQIETSQDLIVALQPLASGDSKQAFGIAITPARTSILPMSGRTYLKNVGTKLLGSATLSYAQNTLRAGNADYRRHAFSIGTTYYLDPERDPIAIGNRAFISCASPKRLEENAKEIAAIDASNLSPSGKQTAKEALTNKLDAELTSCIDDVLKRETRWNDSRASLTYGEGRIVSPAGDGHSLGRSLGLNVQIRAGEKGVGAISVRHTRNALDTESLTKAQLDFKNSSLVAARFTYGDQEGTNFRALIEGSNAKSSSAAAFKDAYIYALGVDKKLAPGAWLELRVGRNRSVENGKEQTTALMNLNIAPSLLPFKK